MGSESTEFCFMHIQGNNENLLNFAQVSYILDSFFSVDRIASLNS